MCNTDMIFLKILLFGPFILLLWGLVGLIFYGVYVDLIKK